MSEVKQIGIIHGIMVAIPSMALAALSSPQQSLNCLLGGMLIGINVAVIVWSVKRMFAKKSVALAAMVIVFKYAAFIAVLVVLYTFGWRANIGFVLGLTTALPTIAWVAYRHLKQSEIDGSF